MQKQTTQAPLRPTPTAIKDLPKPPDPNQEAAPQSKLSKKQIITLEFPVTFAGETYDQLTVRRVKAKDFRQLDMLEGAGNAQAIAMAALICGVDEAVIDELDAVDYMRVQEAIASFFPVALISKLQARASGS